MSQVPEATAVPVEPGQGTALESTSNKSPVVIAPIAQVVVTSSEVPAQNNVANSALQAISSLFQAGSGTSQPTLNITDYINALVTTATSQEPKVNLAGLAGLGGGLNLSSLPLGGVSVGQNTTSLGNALEGLFSLAPAMNPPVVNAPGPIKVEQVTVEKKTTEPLAALLPDSVAFESIVETQEEEPESPLNPSNSDEFGTSIKRRRPQVSRTKDEKLICLVCGDKALGCNFDAVSCESCKAFFRRNALKEKKGKCLFEGNCKIDVNTRRFCPFCRLEKCFTVGMRKEFILSEDAKRKRSLKKERGAKEEQGPLSPPATPSISAPATPSPLTPSAPNVSTTPTQLQQQPTAATAAAQLMAAASSTNLNAAGIQAVIKSLTQQQTPQSTPSTFNANPANTAPTQITLQIPAGSTESVNLLSLSRFVKTTENFNVPMDSYLVRRLTVEESQMLQELMQIYDLSFTVDLEPLVHITQVDPSLNQLVNQSSITVLRIIKFAKRLEEFVRLPQECQIGILKGCWIHMLLLRSVSAYDNERDLWVTPRGEIPTGILKNATGFDRLHDDHVKYCKSIRSIIKDDLTIVVLLIVTALFAPEGPHVLTRELVSNIQDKYLVLLKHYLESKYMYGQAAEMFPQLMSKMKELKELAEDHGKYLLDVNPNEIEPIMLEILDLQ